ncbi:WbqC family protein [Xanthomarina sp. GH4-25]|uniref:WbqC family protein n=1 Tax=Xanthomarina sp. GH4-25 TaxID=3349335 RepID=UPI003878176E
MKVAIMQPYIFPYIGYFQLIQAVDIFVFYDDVNFIKKGFIHRNNLLFQNRKTRFTIPCKGISQNKRINQIVIDAESPALKKLLISIRQNYLQAPFFNQVMPLLETFFNSAKPNQSIAQFAMESVQLVSNYLDLDTTFKVSSEAHAESFKDGREDRLIAIVKKEHGQEYYNAVGGQELYSKAYFKNQGIALTFLESLPINYQQFNNEFVPWLSIIDVMMFNSKQDILNLINAYKLK